MTPQPLRVHPKNPRYVTDDGKRAILLVGSHTWDNLKDMHRNDPPDPFDWDAYLAFLESHHHNFIRLWTWDHTVWNSRANAQRGKDYVHVVAPHPWLRTGPGNALDGKPRFDLTKFNPEYFDRLRHRVASAGARGVYASVMLFEGWCLFHANRGRQAEAGWAWRSHPFNPENNVNGLEIDAGADGLDGFVHRLGNEKVNALQAAYVRKAVDTVNDIDTALYEVINEGGQPEWDWWIAELLHDYEKTKPKQHLIGITGHGSEGVESMLASPADWISPGRNDGFGPDAPAWHQTKPSLFDTDHIWGCGGNAEWVWKSLTRGHNPIFMDPYLGAVLCDPNDTWWHPIRSAMGHARRLTERIDLAASEPRGYLASSGYCLAVPRSDYIVFAPGSDDVTVDLRGAPGSLSVEWIHPVTGETSRDNVVGGGAKRAFQSPIEGDAVLFLSAHSG